MYKQMWNKFDWKKNSNKGFHYDTKKVIELNTKFVSDTSGELNKGT